MTNLRIQKTILDGALLRPRIGIETLSATVFRRERKTSGLSLLEEIHDYSNSNKIVHHLLQLPKMCKYIINDKLKGFTHAQELSHH